MPEDLLTNLSLVVSVADYLETVYIGAYLAATRRFAGLGMPLMPEVAHQYLPWERPTLCQVSQAQQFLAAFLTGGNAFGRDFVGPTEMPPKAAEGHHFVLICFLNELHRRQHPHSGPDGAWSRW